MDWNGTPALLGISTFTEGFGGRFGDIGGGVVLEPYWGWIAETTGLSLVPEPATYARWFGLIILIVIITQRKRF